MVDHCANSIDVDSICFDHVTFQLCSDGRSNVRLQPSGLRIGLHAVAETRLPESLAALGPHFQRLVTQRSNVVGALRRGLTTGFGPRE